MTPLILLAAAVTALVVSVHDGDTLTVTIDGRRDTVRLTAIDAPELPPRARCFEEIRRAEAARAALAALLPEGQPVRLHIDHGRPRDKYRRLLADVALPGGRDAGESLLRAGLARPYRGGKRGGWCP